MIMGGGFWFGSKNSAQENNIFDKITLAESAGLSTASPDSDVDGLKDWEEQLWGTDPNNPDTDGDGTSDDEEIRLNRNPLKASPDDFLFKNGPTSETSGGLEEIAEDLKDLTLTDQLARQLFTSYLLSKQSRDSTLTEEEINVVIDSFRRNTEDIHIAADPFSQQDAIISADTSKNAVKNYVNALGKITNEAAEEKDIRENELDLLTRLLRESNLTSNFSGFSRFYDYASAHAKAAEEIKKLAVPASYLDIHISLVNIFSAMEKITLAFANLSNDPLKGLVAAEDYTEQAVGLARILTELKNRLASDGIIIAPEEDGYILIN